MASFICDDLAKKNNIGEIVKANFENGCRITFLLAPYFSETDKYLDFSKIKEEIRILCDANDASCNPYTLEKLIKRKNVEIKSRNDIHAKVYLLDKVAIVTSANPTPNGLGVGKIEAGVLLDNEQSINAVKTWLDNLWEDEDSEDIRKFDDKTWAKLKANWDLSNSSGKNTLPKLSDLIKAKRIPKDIVFLFWYDAIETPNQKAVAKQASETIKNLPESLANWDYWIEDESKQEKIDSTDLKQVLHTYRNSTIINIKTKIPDGIGFKKAFRTENFPSKSFDVPLIFKWNRRFLLLSFYRKDIEKIFDVDAKSIDMINNSLNDKNKKSKWDGYFKSKDGLQGYCSAEKLYELVD